MPMIEMPMEELKVYAGSSPKPADFEQYWQESLRELDETGMDCEVKPAAFKAKGAVCSHLYFTGTGGARIHCKLLMPEKPGGPVPGIVLFHGYFGNAGSWSEKLHYVNSLGAAVLAMDVRGQGGTSQSVYAGVETLYGQVVQGVEDEDPKALFYRHVYLDAVKAARLLMQMDGVDAGRIGVCGPSQGGALAVACAALEPRVKRTVPIYPFLSDFVRVRDLAGYITGYRQFDQHFRYRDPLHQREDAFFQRLGYIDIQNLAPRVKADVLWLLGLMDDVCPPSTQFAAFNKIISHKEMLIYPDFGHEPLYKSADKVYNYFMEL
ncbi:MAG: acetylxylan esterase [Oscillospiraceae bacterium]